VNPLRDVLTLPFYGDKLGNVRSSLNHFLALRLFYGIRDSLTDLWGQTFEVNISELSQGVIFKQMFLSDVFLICWCFFLFA